MNAHFWNRHSVETTCAVDIEQTGQNLYAHAIPTGIDLRPGDIVITHDAPGSIDFGQRHIGDYQATVLRAGPIARFWTRLTSILELTQLFEVGFEAKESP